MRGLECRDGKVLSAEELMMQYDKEQHVQDLFESDVQKIDPDNGQKYSFPELHKKYCNTRSQDSIVMYWDTECTQTPWPDESKTWTVLERKLFFQSQGMYHPDIVAAAYQRGPIGSVQMWKISVPGRVSICVPTLESRQMFHKQLWMLFDSQAWEDKELVVVETYTDSPSPFFTEKAKEDSRLVYLPFARPNEKDWSIGLKRNICTHMASGEILVNFDDDDIYASRYVSTMVHDMQESNASAVKLCAWYHYDAINRKLGFTDTSLPKNTLTTEKDEGTGRLRLAATVQVDDGHVYGFGFSYVFYRSAAIKIPFDDKNMCEDYDFMRALRLEAKIKLRHDRIGICLHCVHPKATSKATATREVSEEEFKNLDIAAYGYLLESEQGSPWEAGVTDLQRILNGWPASSAGN
eukprot:gnl/MRDRNA2_/MRDRNA2_64176_c0_seq3.p1 gnl/MRDRNA2_/MRDRNA2_64176_c0~~gnl/MRDRNA2_/MRDRNA2_64176_c0_seq3.p1  ORF type:complete len:408 (-),score=66.06 gnl/MRDRNA2_/MRDRNA2_64176_c0_seq3:32-1255(-)